MFTSISMEIGGVALSTVFQTPVNETNVTRTLNNMVELSEIDPNSFSRPDECIVTHLHLDVDVDFVDRKLRGSVRMVVRKMTPSANRLVSGYVSDSPSEIHFLICSLVITIGVLYLTNRNRFWIHRISIPFAKLKLVRIKPCEPVYCMKSWWSPVMNTCKFFYHHIVV